MADTDGLLSGRKSEALLLARALKNGAADKTSSKRLREIIGILWKHRLYQGVSPQNVVSVMEDLGPTFVKMGQIMSARRDIFPEEYCDAFASLRTQATPMSFEEVTNRLNEVYDGDYTKVFSTLEPTPLGSASVAQVHKAVIRETGDVVAVKVQRPQVKKLMNDDISLLRRANDLLEITPLGHGGFEISAFVDELDRTVKDEIDFRKEAQNLKDFRRNCEDVEHITSPRVFEDLTSETILVMDYVEGPHIDDVDAIAHMDVDMHEMGTLITQNYIKQMLDDGLFHADPHAGNIIVVPDGIEWIDLGMVGRLTANDRGLLRQLFFAVASRDPQELKKTLLIWGRPVGDIDQGRLLRELDAMISRYASDDIADLDIASALGDLLALIRGQHIMMPPSFTMLARGIMSFEGTIETIAPDISIVGSIDEYMRHSLIADFDVRQELRDALMALRKLSKKGFNAPSQLFDVLDMLMKGELSVRVEPRELEKPMSKLESTIDRLTLGMITAGLFIGSSMLCMTQMEPRILGIPAIGFLGFLGALILSLYIVFKGRP